MGETAGQNQISGRTVYPYQRTRVRAYADGLDATPLVGVVPQPASVDGEREYGNTIRIHGPSSAVLLTKPLARTRNFVFERTFVGVGVSGVCRAGRGTARGSDSELKRSASSRRNS